MTDVRDPESLIQAAQEAASAGDYAAAERLLRDAAAVQEATLGPEHPDLAITLNNLAFVCERTNKFDEAERGYRRAHKVAVASLAPGHPFIATSLQNLVDFCAAHEIPIWRPPAATDDEMSFESEAAQPEPAAAVEAAPTEPMQPVAGRRPAWSSPTLVFAALAVVVLVVVAFAMQLRETTVTATPEAVQPASPPSDSRVTKTPAPAPSPAAEPEPVPTVVPTPTPDSKPAPIEPAKPRETTVAPASVTVLKAQVCRALVRTGAPDWQCTAADSEGRPGTFAFYTRLLTDRNTTVEHRWYLGERVHRTARLSVTASPGVGFRTFSTTTITADRAGDWKVELRAADGSVLHEERFLVR